MNRLSQQLLAETLAKCDRQARAFEDAEHRVAQQGAKELLQVARRICTLIKESMTLELAGITDDDAYQRVCHTRQRLLDYFHEWVLQRLSPAPPTSYPAELLPYIEEELRSISDDYSFLMISAPEQNYSMGTVNGLYSGFVNRLDPYVPPELATDDESHEWLVILRLPHIDARNVLGHASVVGHELMHFKDRAEGITDGLITSGTPRIGPRRLREIVNADVRAAQGNLTTVGARSFRESRRTQVASDANDLLRNWTREIVADLLAVHLYGPAACLALARLAFSQGELSITGVTHPDPALRIQLMREELRHLGYSLRSPLLTAEERTLLRKVNSELDLWDTTAKSTQPTTTEIGSIVRDSVRRSKTAITTNIRGLISGRSYTASSFAAEVPQLAELLAFGVPPAQIVGDAPGEVTAASLAGILNAGHDVWLFRREEIRSQISENATDSECLEVLNRLVLKAIEALTFYKAECRIHST